MYSTLWCRAAAVFALGSVAGLAGCGGSSSSSASPTQPTQPTSPTTNPAVTAKNVIIVDEGKDTVDTYQANLNGFASPSSNISASAQLTAVAGDASGNTYVATISQGPAVVDVFSSGSTSLAHALTITNGVKASLNQITTMVTDKSGNLYVAFPDVIYEFASGASGNAAPIRTLTSLSASPDEMALDSSGNLYVAEGQDTSAAVVIFGPTANGNTTPTVFANYPSYAPTGVAIDSSDNIYISQGNGSCGGCGVYSPAINVFSKGAVAGSKPIRTITGSQIGVGTYANTLAVDSGGNIFLGNIGQGYECINVYSATANGNVAPASELIPQNSSGSDTQWFLR